jgi:hypothetical protein
MCLLIIVQGFFLALPRFCGAAPLHMASNEKSERRYSGAVHHVRIGETIANAIKNATTCGTGGGS